MKVSEKKKDRDIERESVNMEDSERQIEKRRLS